MAYTVSFYYAVIVGGLMSIAALVFTIIMISNFIKKKTIGTAILAMMYSMIFFRMLFNMIFSIYSTVAPETFMHKLSILIYLGALFMTYAMLYFFTSRHILNDNDVMRIFYSMLLFGVNFIIISFMGYEMFTDVANPLFYHINFQEATEMYQYQPTQIASFILYLPILFFVQIRILIVMTNTYFRKKQIDPVRRRGFLYILLSVLFLFINLLITMLFIIEGLSQIALIIIYTSRAIATFLTLYFSYVGWILPNWFKRRVRGRAWIADKIIMGEKPKGQYLTSTTLIEETKIIRETTEI